MWGFVVAFIISVMVNYSSQQLTPQQEEHIKQCANETDIDLMEMMPNENGTLPDDNKMKCFTKCSFIKSGYMTDTGEFVLDAIKQSPRPPGVTEEKFVEMVDTCTKDKEDDLCDSAHKVLQCFVDETVKILQS